MRGIVRSLHVSNFDSDKSECLPDCLPLLSLEHLVSVLEQRDNAGVLRESLEVQAGIVQHLHDFPNCLKLHRGENLFGNKHIFVLPETFHEFVQLHPCLKGNVGILSLLQFLHQSDHWSHCTITVSNSVEESLEFEVVVLDSLEGNCEAGKEFVRNDVALRFDFPYTQGTLEDQLIYSET